MFRSTKLNKFCICFRGLKLGPSPPLSEASRSLPIDFNGLFIQPLLGLKFIVIKLLSFFPDNADRFWWSWHAVHVTSITPWDTSFWKGCRYPEPLPWEQEQLSFLPGACGVKWWDTVSLPQLLVFIWLRRKFISKLEFLQVFLILSVFFGCQLF